MPDATIPRTPNGWPLLDQDNFIRATPEYTRQLAEKLDAGEADVAAAINAATRAQAAAAKVPIIHTTSTGSFSIPGTSTGTTFQRRTITFPPGRFTKPPLVWANLATGPAGGSNRVILSVSDATSTSVDVWFWAVPGSHLAGLTLRANILAIQLGV